MFKKIILGLGVIIAAFCVIVATRPADFKVTRTATINGTNDKVFALVNDFHQWEKWSPWAKLDPTAKNTFSGPEAGVGSTFQWAGNKDVGEGKMTILESRPTSFVKIQLDFLKPFAATNIADFTMTPQGDQTLVAWTMYGKKNFIAKAVGMFIDCDKMIGGMFEKGLANMNTAVGAPQ